MSATTKIACYNFDPCKQGDTFDAISFAATGTETELARVRVTIKDIDGNTELSLDSDSSGVILNTTTAGAWDYTVGPVTAAQTAAMDAGIHHYDIETTDAGGTVKTHFQGQWEITSQTTS